jgi:hypothetical protein
VLIATLAGADILSSVRRQRRFAGVLTQALLTHMLMLGGNVGCSRADAQSPRAHEHEHSGSILGPIAGDRVDSATHAHERCDVPCTPAGCATASTHCSSIPLAAPARAFDAPRFGGVVTSPTSESSPPLMLTAPDTPPPRA